MTTISRERLEQLADEKCICKVSWDERIELARIALASLDNINGVEQGQKYWYLVSWGSGRCGGFSEVWFDHPWRTGDAREAIKLISNLNDDARVMIKSVFPIDPGS